jgi:hypothetical protein
VGSVAISNRCIEGRLENKRLWTFRWLCLIFQMWSEFVWGI